MPVKIQPTYAKARTKLVAVMGDSLTNNYDLGVPGTLLWPELLASSLRTLGCAVRAQNTGRSGNTTTQMVQRFPTMTRVAVPTLGIIFGGVNDTSVAAATTVASGSSSTVFVVQAGFGARYNSNGTAGGSILVNGTSRIIQSVSTDTITVASSLGFTPSAGQAVSPDTSTNLQSMIATLVAAGCTKVLVLSSHYLNYSAGGDALATPYATYATLRAVQSAAVTAAQASAPSASIVYGDLYTYMRGLIVAGTYVQGSASWHVADLNQHLNAVGNQIVRDFVLATIQAQSGWVTALT